jgi:uncharacterized protein (TIGR03067 family)
MKKMVLLCLAAALSLPLFGFAMAGDVKPPDGVWKPVAATLGGQPVPPALLDTITLKLAGDSYEAIVGDQPDKGTAKLDTSVSPHRMSITSVDGPNRGKIFLAIYEITDADNFRVCYDLSGKQYPTEFKSTEGTQLYLVSYTRKKG